MDPYDGGDVRSGVKDSDYDDYSGPDFEPHQDLSFTSLVERCIPDNCWTLSVVPVDMHPCGCLNTMMGDLKFKATLGNDTLVGFHDEKEICLKNIRFGKCASEETRKCEDGELQVGIEITFNDEPWVAGGVAPGAGRAPSWELTDQNCDTIRKSPSGVIEGLQDDYYSDYMVQGATLYEELCKPLDDCYYFELIDSGVVNGFKVLINGDEVSSKSSVVEIGDMCKKYVPNLC